MQIRSGVSGSPMDTIPMQRPTDEQIAGLLVRIISDGFNRSIAALEEAGAVDATEMKNAYAGVGSKYYDLVTIQMSKTAQFCTPAVRKLFEPDDGK